MAKKSGEKSTSKAKKRTSKAKKRTETDEDGKPKEPTRARVPRGSIKRTPEQTKAVNRLKQQLKRRGFIYPDTAASLLLTICAKSPNDRKLYSDPVYDMGLAVEHPEEGEENFTNWRKRLMKEHYLDIDEPIKNAIVRPGKKLIPILNDYLQNSSLIATEEAVAEMVSDLAPTVQEFKNLKESHESLKLEVEALRASQQALLDKIEFLEAKGEAAEKTVMYLVHTFIKPYDDEKKQKAYQEAKNWDGIVDATPIAIKKKLSKQIDEAVV